MDDKKNYRCTMKLSGSFVSDHVVTASSKYEALKEFLETKVRYEQKEWNQVEIKVE